MSERVEGFEVVGKRHDLGRGLFVQRCTVLGSTWLRFLPKNGDASGASGYYITAFKTLKAARENKPVEFQSRRKTWLPEEHERWLERYYRGELESK